MDPTIIAATTAIVTLIGKKALEEGGKKIGAAAFKTLEEIIQTIRSKFDTEGILGKLDKAQKDPSEKNLEKLKNELADQMEEDHSFSNKLKELILNLESDKKVKQLFLTNAEVKDNIELENIEQEISNSNSGNQELMNNIKVEGKIIAKNVKQKQ